MFLPWNTGWCRRPFSSFLLQGPTDTHIHTQTKSDGGTPAATHADTHARAAGVKQPGMRVESSHGDVWNPEWVRKDREKEKQGEGPEGSSLYFVRDRGKQSIWPPSSPRGHFLIAPVPNPDDEGAWEVMRADFWTERVEYGFLLCLVYFFFLCIAFPVNHHHNEIRAVALVLGDF